MAVSAGTAYLDVAPRLNRNFSRDLTRDMLRPMARSAERSGRDSGRRYGTRFSTGLRAGLGPVTGIARVAGGALAAAFGGAVVAKGLKSTIDAASDLNETLSKSRVIFGRSSRDIEQWSRNSARDFGLSRNEAIGAAASFGDMFLQLKLGRPAAVNMSKGMVTLAADMASFHNADITQVLEAQSAAFRGEYDSVQRFIPGITAARVEQEALRMTHKKSAKDLTAAEKAQAVYNIMLKDGKRATGDFGRTADGAANRQRILRARVEDLKASIGQGLLPAYAGLLGFITDRLVPGLGTLAGKIRDSGGPAVAGLTAGVQAKFDAFKPDFVKFKTNLVAAVKKLVKPVIDGFSEALGKGDLHPLGRAFGGALPALVTDVLPGFTRLIGDMVAKVDWMTLGQQAVKAAVPFVLGFVGGFIDAVISAFRKDFWRSVFAVLSVVPIGRAAGILLKVLGKIPILGSLLRAISTAGRGVEKPIFAVVASIGRFFVQAFQRAFPAVSGRFGRWITSLIFGVAGRANQMKQAAGRFVGGLREGILDQAGLVIRNIAQLIGWLTKPFRTAGGWLLRAGGQVVTGLIRGVEAIGRGLGRVAARVIGWLLTPFRPAAHWLVTRGREVIQGLGQGIVAKLGDVTAWMGRTRDRVISPFANAIGWLRQAGRNVLHGFWEGLVSKWESVKKWFLGIPTWIKEHKGPLSLDRRLLFPAGAAIMGGFAKGLRSGAGGAMDFVKGIVGDLWSMVTGGGSAKGLVGYAATAFQFFKDMFPGMTIGGWRAQGSVPGSDHPKGKALDLMTYSAALHQRIISMFMDLPGAKYWISKGRIASYPDWNPRPYYGPDPHDSHPHLSFFKQGAWKLLEDQLGYLHKGEMVVPAGPAERIRQGGGGTDPAELGAAVAAALHGTTVQLDGQAVGALVVEPQFRDLRRILRSSGRPSR